LRAESIASDRLSLFQSFVEAVYDLIYDVDQSLLGSTHEADLRLLKDRTVGRTENLLSSYRNLINGLKEMEDVVWDDTLTNSVEKFWLRLNNLNTSFNQSRLETDNVQELIMDFKLSCQTVDIGLKSLWDTAAANIMAYYGDVTGLDAIARFYPMTRSYVYIRRGLIWSVDAYENKDAAEAISSVYLPALKKLESECEELKACIKAVTDKILNESKIHQIYEEIYSKARKIRESVGNIRSLEIKSVDELGLVLRQLWREIFFGVLTQKRVPPKLQISELEKILQQNGGVVDMDKISETLESITTAGRENSLIYTSFYKYKKAAAEYEVLASAYELAIDNLKHIKSSALHTSFLVSVKYWKKQKEDCLKEGRQYELEEVSKRGKEADASAEIGLHLDSIRSIDEAIEGKELVDTEVAALLLKRGTLFSQMNRPDKALECYKMASEIKPDYIDAKHNMGSSLIELRRYEEAQSLYERITEINPEDYLGWWGKGLSLYFMDRYDEAISSYDRAIALKPDEHELWYNKGTVYYLMEDYVAAESCYRRAKSINPESLAILVNLSEIMLILKKYEECNNLVKQIRNLPGNEKYRFALTLISVCGLYLSNNKDDALARTEVLLNYYESNYYESISTKTNTDISLTDEWTYVGIQKMVERIDISAEEKRFITSLVSLTEAKKAPDMIRAVETVRNSIPRTKPKENVNVKDRILAALKRNDARENEIKVVNTFSPMMNREGWYNWEIHIEAPKAVLSMIQSVTYILHPTFKEPEKTVSRSDGGFMLRSSGWGEFKVKVKINLKGARTITKYHWLNLSDPTLSSRYSHIS
jgi:tetratricopeptide (TPR) repeat protein